MTSPVMLGLVVVFLTIMAVIARLAARWYRSSPRLDRATRLSKSGRWSDIQNDGSRLHTLGMFGSWGRGPGELSGPRFLLQLDEGILVADSGNDRLQIFSADGEPIRVIHGGQPGHPTGLATDGTHLWVADSSNCSVSKIRLADGAHLARIGNCTRRLHRFHPKLLLPATFLPPPINSSTAYVRVVAQTERVWTSLVDLRDLL